jgi:hypothetical protein
MAGLGGGGGAGIRWGGSNVGRYREDKPEFKTRGFYLEVVMDHRRVPDLLVALANSDWPVNVLRVQMADHQDEDLSEADGAGGMMGGMGAASAGARGGAGMHSGGTVRSSMGMRPGAAGPAGHGERSGSRPPMPRSGRPTEEAVDVSGTQRSALDDPNLANVAIVGTIYIFKKPAQDKPAVVAPASGAPATTPAVTPPAAAAASTPATTAPAAETDKDAGVSSGEDRPALPAEGEKKETEKSAEPVSDKPDPKPAEEKPSEAATKTDQSN